MSEMRQKFKEHAAHLDLNGMTDTTEDSYIAGYRAAVNILSSMISSKIAGYHPESKIENVFWHQLDDLNRRIRGTAE